MAVQLKGLPITRMQAQGLDRALGLCSRSAGSLHGCEAHPLAGAAGIDGHRNRCRRNLSRLCLRRRADV